MHEGACHEFYCSGMLQYSWYDMFSVPLGIHQLCGEGYHICDSCTFVGFVDKTQTIMCSILGRKL